MRSYVLVLPFLAACHAHHAQTFNPEVLRAEKGALTEPGQADSWVQLGTAYFEVQKYDEAKAAFDEALRLDEDNSEAKAGIESLQETNWISEIERTALAEPRNDEVWGDIGDHFAERGMKEVALGYYLHAMALDPADSEWQQKVVESGSQEEVLALFESNAVHNQDNDEWLGDYGDLLARMDRRDDACAQYSNALALDPEDSEWIQRVDECNSGAPLAVSPDMGGMHPEHGMMEHGEAYGEALSGQGDPEAQISNLENLLEGEPENDEYMGRLGVLLADQGNMERASELLLGAFALDPTDSVWPRTVSALTGRSRVDLLSEALESHAENDELHGDLGDAYVDLGRTQEALEAYRRALELDPDDAEWKNKLSLLGD